MARVAAHHEDDASASNDLAAFTDPLDAGSNFHDFNTLFWLLLWSKAL
jgi:hypothetical protein